MKSFSGCRQLFALCFLSVALRCQSDTIADAVPSQPSGPSLPAILHNRVVFSSDRIRSSGDIFYVLLDGTGLLQVTDTALGAACPQVSPDGKKIALERLSTFYVMNVDGTGAKDVTPSLPYRSLNCPAWSPNSKTIAFTRVQYQIKAPASSELYVVNADGTGLKLLATGDSFGGVAWSPKGDKLLFESHHHTDGGPYDFATNVINADGTGLTRIPDAVAGLAWSPDGTRISFACGKDYSRQLCVAPADGTAGTPISTVYQSLDVTAWSPDGKFIVYTCGITLCVTSPDGTGTRTLAQHAGYNSAPVWSPDSKFILYSCNDSNRITICAVNADGSNDRIFITYAGNNTSPSFAPLDQ